MTAMSSINALLNPDAPTISDPMPTTTHDAADALTALATLGPGQQYVPATRALPSPTPAPARHARASSFGDRLDPAAPVEPDPPADPPAVRSPTLHAYHHAARSPDELKRRQSLLTEPAPVLAPMLSEHHQAPILPEHHDAPAEPRLSPPSDPDTLKAIDAAKSDLGLRTKRPASVADSLPDPQPSKKRPAPSSSALKKKGTAKTTKPAPKKRRLDDDDKARSVTPTARPKSKKGTPALHSSPAPDDARDDDDGDSSEDHNLYCICKKPDNHKWMIGCDGGCDDWFHGDCVNMKQADENLVDKFICPLCQDQGRGTTTWKPMCRRDGCRMPARVVKDHESKYCSDDCGVLFMQEQLQRTAGAKDASKSKKKKKVARPDDLDDDEPTPLGGVLRAKDLKALIDASPNIQAFRNLGSGVLSPPHTASPTRPNFPKSPDDITLTPAETERLTALHNEKSQLNDRLQVLKDRDKFVSMAKEQAARIAEREKLKLKEFCGYDSRLSWSDAEFLLWRNSPHGRAAFTHSTLSPTPEQISLESPNLPTDPPKETVCLKKRCPKHPQWQKINSQDARFEELEVVESIRECEKEERSVRERARRRSAKDDMARELRDGDKGRNRDGWVEVACAR